MTLPGGAGLCLRLAACAGLLAACGGRARPAPAQTLAAPAASPQSASLPPSPTAASPEASPTLHASPTAPAPSPTPPVRPASATPTPSPAIRLLFTGDINPGRCPAQAALRMGDFTLPYHAVGERLRAADITVGSLDGAISDLSPPSPCPETMNLIGPSATVDGLLFAGFDVISVAANHAKDCGRLGWVCGDQSFRDTLRHLASAGILAAGGGENLAAARAPVFVERQGVRFAFLGVDAIEPAYWAQAGRPGTAPLSAAALDEVLAGIAAARSQADAVVVLAQWGVEYAPAPTPEQLDWAGRMIDAGAALVIGNHPHVVQAVEVFPTADGGPRGLAAYALGNFVFDQGTEATQQGVVLEAVFRGPALESWTLHPIRIHRLHQPRWAAGEEAEAILARIAEASAALPLREPAAED